MTPLGDYLSEMDTLRQIDDLTAETLLSGRPVAGEFEALVPVVEAYRALGRRPVAPRGELAARMVTGVFTSTAGPGRVAADRVDGRGPRAVAGSKWRRIRMAIVGGLATAAAKVAGLSVATKASAGLMIAAASIGTAGAAGVLPDQAQAGFDRVVETVIQPETPATPDENAEFGQEVSEDAKDGGVDGAEISERARQQGELHRPDGVPAPGEEGKPSDLPVPDGSGLPTPDDLPGQGSPPESPPVPPRP